MRRVTNEFESNWFNGFSVNHLLRMLMYREDWPDIFAREWMEHFVTDFDESCFGAAILSVC